MTKKSSEDIAGLIRECAQTLMDLADSLETKKTSTENPEKKISFTDLRGRLAEKSRAGYGPKIKELLAKHGAEKLSEIAESEYEQLLAEAEALP